MSNLRVVSENEEPVEQAPTWVVIIEVAPNTFSQDIIQGYPSYSGPLMAFFDAEDEEGVPIFMCPYHRVVKIAPFKAEQAAETEEIGQATLVN